MTAYFKPHLDEAQVETAPYKQAKKQQEFNVASPPGKSIGNQWLASSLLGEKSYPIVVIASVGVYWLFVSLIPVYNKYFFKKEFYPYPIATAGIQLGVVATLLVLVNMVQTFFSHHKRRQSLLPDAEEEENEFHVHAHSSWIFGPHFLWKLKWTAPIGILFGLKYGVTNLGLHMVPATTHLLLQSTDMVWTLLGAWFINKEGVTAVGFACVVGCIAGSVALSIQVQETISAPLPAIAINLLSPILLGLCITTLRLACSELMRKDNRVGGTVSSVELSAIKLIISAAVAICLACIFEGEHTKILDSAASSDSLLSSSDSGDLDDDDDNIMVVPQENVLQELENTTMLSLPEEYAIFVPSWSSAFQDLPQSVKLGVMGGALLILVFQVNCTFLTFLTSAVALGLVGQAKILPQWIAAAILLPSQQKHISVVNVIGSVLTMASAVAFALFNLLAHKYPGRFQGASFNSHHHPHHHHQHQLYNGKEEQSRLLFESEQNQEDSSPRSDYESIHKQQHHRAQCKTRGDATCQQFCVASQVQ